MTNIQLCNLRRLLPYSLKKRVFATKRLLCPCRCEIDRRFATETVPTIKNCKDDNTESFEELIERFREKVIYHTFYKYEDFVLQKKKEFAKSVNKGKQLDKLMCAPVSLKYFLDEELNGNSSSNKEEENSTVSKHEEKSIVLPYEVSTVNVSETSEDDLKSDKKNEINLKGYNRLQTNVTKRGRWMRDYDCYEQLSGEESDDDVDSNYGTPDQSLPISNVPCGGCGALLHCQDPGIPGYLPSEIFTECDVRNLRAITCQRCHFMKHYKTALSVSVDAEQYPKLLSKIKDEFALVILLVDVTDFPCSIWPGILDIIGPKRPLFVIGNKVDLLLGDRNGWIRRARDSLQAALPQHANIKYCSLISAKTGFGVEELINKLHTIWEYKGAVYLVGCTNVGKSTLFNTLLQSDYCNVHASDLIQRATTAPWPGTTMNLLKFPILRPSGLSLFLRTKRLKEKQQDQQKENHLLKLQTAKAPAKPFQLVGHIGRTFSKVSERDDSPDVFKSSRWINTTKLPESGLNPNLSAYRDSRWFYDTPGVVQPDQIINLLTTDELMKTLPKSPIIERVFIFRQNWTIFIAGLGRVDFIKLTDSGRHNSDFIKIVVFRPNTLPVTICETDKADSLYKDYIGTDMFVVPSGGPDRLKVWPSLKSIDIVVQGKSMSECCADIVLSNAGWISIAAKEQQLCKFRCWSPAGRGIHVRRPPLMPYAVTIHGPRLRQTPAYSKRYLKEVAHEKL